MTKFYQIYWDDRQLINLYPFSTPYKNEGLTPYFENSVIASIVSCETSERVGVCSHELRQKIGGGVPMRCELTEEMIEQPYEVLSLGRNQGHHQMIWRLGYWHKGADRIFMMIFDKLGKQRPAEPKNPIYQNHFIAQTEIYKAYVSEMLVPAMELMEKDEEMRQLVNVDSGYYKLKPPYGEYAARVKQFLGTDYAPLHAFLCERLFSCWINTQRIKVTYIDEIMKRICI